MKSRVALAAICIFLAALLVGCSNSSAATRFGDSVGGQSSAQSPLQSQYAGTVEYHGLTYTVPDGFYPSGNDENNDAITYGSNGLGSFVVRYFENVGEDFIDSGIFEERNGYVEGGTEFNYSVTIERSLNNGHKAIKWAIEDPLVVSIGYSVMVGTDQIAFNYVPGLKSGDEFEVLIESVKVNKAPDNAVEPSSWESKATIKSAAVMAEEEEAAAAAAREEAEKARKNATHSAGSYKVGSDIPAGEYKLTATNGKGYFCVYPDTTKDDILENDNFSSVTYVTVEDGQYLELNRASMVEVAYAIATPTPSGNGMYKIGFDLPAGEYKLNSSGRGYYCIYDNSTVSRDILQNSNFDGSTYCVVSDGQYLVISRATIE